MSIAAQLNRIKLNVANALVAIANKGITLNGDEGSDDLATLIQQIYGNDVTPELVEYNTALVGIYLAVNRVQVNILNALAVFTANGVNTEGLNSDNLAELIDAIDTSSAVTLFSLIDDSGNTIVDNSGNYLVSDVEPTPSVTTDIEGNVLVDDNGQAVVSSYT